MTIDEFNKKYKDYLEEGFYGLVINDSDVINYVDNMFNVLIKLPGFTYSQIKLKFGLARVYIDANQSLTSVASIMEDNINKMLEVKKLNK